MVLKDNPFTPETPSEGPVIGKETVQVSVLFAYALPQVLLGLVRPILKVLV